MRRFTYGMALAVATVLGVAAPVHAQDDGITLGETPDPPVVETLDGSTVDLAEVVGTKPVLVQFWATWCVICQALEPRVRTAHDAFGEEVEFLTVAVGVAQDQADVRRHLARHPVPGRVLWDGRGNATRAFEAPGTGYIVILDREGTVAYTGTGTDQDLMAALDRVVND